MSKKTFPLSKYKEEFKNIDQNQSKVSFDGESGKVYVTPIIVRPVHYKVHDFIKEYEDLSSRTSPLLDYVREYNNKNFNDVIAVLNGESCRLHTNDGLLKIEKHSGGFFEADELPLDDLVSVVNLLLIFE